MPESTSESWDSVKVALVDRYDAGYAALNNGEGCGSFSNDDGTISWAQSYLLHSLIDAYRGTRRRHYLDAFVHQTNLVLQQADIVRGLTDYRGISTWAWSATRYSPNGERAFWLVDDAVIVAPLVRFAQVVSEDAKLVRRYGDVAARYAEIADSAMVKFDSLYQQDPQRGEGQYVLPAGFPAAIGHPMEQRPLPLNHDAAAGRVHALLWAVSGDRGHRQRAIEIGRRIQRHLILDDDRYIWRYWGSDGQILFNDSWDDISHAAITVGFVATLNNVGLLFDDQDMQRFARTLLAQQAEDGFLRNVASSEADLTLSDPKCGHIWPRRYSDASGRWLVVQNDAVYSVVQSYFSERSSDLTILSDPQLLAGMANLIRYYVPTN